MIILLNGAFGVGKTTVAENLHHAIDNSMLYDPEIVGYMLREMLPTDIKRAESPRGDFQDFHLWKDLVVEMASRLKQQYGKHLIVPMTIRNHTYYTHITEGFKAIDSGTIAFCLTASKETIHQRLLKRGETEGDWCFQQTDGCLDAYETNGFGVELDTEHQSVTEIVEYILSQTKQRIGKE